MPEARETFKAKGARFVRFYPSDWRSGCIGLTVEQEGLYWRICAHYYETGRRLPLDDKEAAHRLMMNPKNYRRVRDELIALEKIRRHDDGYGNDRAERELKKAVGEPAQKVDAVLAADLDAARGSSDCERQDGGDQGQGRQGAEPVPAIDSEIIVDQSSINRESIVDQSGILVENSERNQGAFLEPVASSQEPKKKTPPTPKGDGLPVQEAYDLWCATALICGLTQGKLTPARRKSIAARLRENDGLAGWKQMLAGIERSSFLTGGQPGRDGGSPFRATIDFVLKPAKFQRIVEGSYGNGRHAEAAKKPKQPAYLSRY